MSRYNMVSLLEVHMGFGHGFSYVIKVINFEGYYGRFIGMESYLE